MISQASDGNSLIVPGRINGKSCHLTIDTGASRTVIHSGLLRENGKYGGPRTSHLQLITATGQRIPVWGEMKIAVKIGEKIYWQEVVVADILDDCIIGLDFLKNHQCSIDVKNGVLNCGNEQIPMEGGKLGKVYSLADARLPPKSQTLVHVKLMGKTEGSPRTVLVERLSDEQRWVVARTLIVTKQKAMVPILNLSSNEQIIKKGTPIGRCNELSWIRECHADARKDLNADKGLVNKLLEECDELTNLERLKARNLFLRYTDTFSTGDGDIGKTGLVKHKINTGDEIPIKQRPRRVPLARESEVEEMIQDMKKNDVIEPSSSPWCSPVVLVKKKDGSTRFCVDYRRLNDVTKKDSYPLPRIDDTLDTLSGMKWFSALDLKSGYWQVELDPTDKEKTAFSTGKGLWQFKVMPFGLCNAPATFERLMEQVLAGLLGDTCLVYLDDIIIVGKDFDDHLRKLEKVLEKLRAANLKLSPKKCSFFKRQVNYLGHVVSENGVQTDPAKTTAVREWPVPKNKTEVRAFLGLCSYYRRFVKGFSDIAKPLHRLTEEKRTFVWNEECNDAFRKLKKSLCETPVLGYPDAGCEFIVDTDASNIGVGGVLSQKQGEQEVVIAYYSKSLSKSERNYCVTRRELLAIVKTLQHFRKYLLGRKFQLRTDHAALRWLLNFKNPEGQVARWIEQLQEYDLQISHRAGRIHGNADGLSRRPCPNTCKHCSRQEQKEIAAARVIRTDNASMDWSDDTMRTAQEDDTDLKPLIQLMKDGATRPLWNQVANYSSVTKCYWAQWDSLVMQNGLLHRKWESTNGNESHLQVIVPRSKVNEVLSAYHDGISGGHLGIKRTLVKIKQKFYWIHCREDVEEWCRKCTKCAAVKGPQTRSRGALKLYNIGAPWERIALDIAGPFPITDKGNRYILVVMDYFSKWPEVFALPNQEATTIARKLVDDIFSRFGLPLEIHSDQGRNFESNVFQETCKILGIHKTRTTPYHPQSDGMVERFNQTLERHLAKLVDSHQKDWDEYIPLFLLAYRTAVHESTTVTPAYVNFGRELRLPVDLLSGCPPDTPADVTDYVNDLRRRMLVVHDQVRAAGLKASEKMKTRYDRNVNRRGFEEGMLVWLHNPVRRKGKSPKLQPSWEGPYTVVTKLNDVTYRIRRTARSPFKIVHVDRLARYYGSNDARDEHD
jgi:predicted aspartyl protease